MIEVIRVGEVEIRFLYDKDGTGGSLNMFELLVPPGAKVPAPHHHRDWDETVYGLAGTMTWTLDGETVETGPGGPPSSAAAWCTASSTATTRRRRRCLC